MSYTEILYISQQLIFYIQEENFIRYIISANHSVVSKETLVGKLFKFTLLSKN